MRALLIVPILSAACVQPDEPAPVSRDPPMVWSECDLTPLSGLGGAECSFVDAPLEHGTNSDSISLGLKRIKPTEPIRAQVWWVNGGPGASAVNDLEAFSYLFFGRSDLELLAVDHRGMGGSDPLDCDAEEAEDSEEGVAIADAEWPACIAHLVAEKGERLAHLTSTASAKDLALVIERARRPGVPVFVFGASYGSYLVQRYLQLFPNQATGAVLQGIAPAGTTFDAFDDDMNEVAALLFAQCALDPVCSDKLGPDPWQVATDVVQSFGRGHCPALGINDDDARSLLGSLLIFSVIRDYTPAIVYRMARCSDADVDVIANFYGSSGLSGLPRGRAFNDGKGETSASFFHIALSEMWHKDGLPDPEDVLARFRDNTMSTGLTLQLANLQSTWPTYPRGPEVTDALPEYDGPLLMLTGTLDAATSAVRARRLRDHFTAPNQHYIEFPYGAHDIVGGTPIRDDPSRDCARELLFQFVDAPTAGLDTACSTETAPVAFSGSPELNDLLLGTADAWE